MLESAVDQSLHLPLSVLQTIANEESKLAQEIVDQLEAPILTKAQLMAYADYLHPMLMNLLLHRGLGMLAVEEIPDTISVSNVYDDAKGVQGDFLNNKRIWKEGMDVSYDLVVQYLLSQTEFPTDIASKIQAIENQRDRHSFMDFYCYIMDLKDDKESVHYTFLLNIMLEIYKALLPYETVQ